MRVPEPLRYGPFRMYRRKSLYTGLYGTNYSGPTRPPGDTTDSAGVPIQSRPNPSHKMYRSGFSDDYAPHPGLMQIPGRDYRPYDGSVVGRATQPVQPAVPGGLPMGALPEGFDLGVIPQDDLTDVDPHELPIELAGTRFNGAALTPEDNAEVSRQFVNVRGDEEISEFDSDLRAHLLEIQMAVEQVRAAPLTPPNAEPHDIRLTIPQDFFEQQEKMFESQLRELEPPEFDYGAEMDVMFEAQESMFNLPELEAAFMEPPTEAMGSLTDPGSESLEQIIEADDMGPEATMPDEMSEVPDYDDSLMTPELFEQGMSEAAEPMEPDPDPMQQYGGVIPQEMYDEQEPDMMDPYMMPGMIDPYMIPGPFGPGPMLDPGPGGPP